MSLSRLGNILPLFSVSVSVFGGLARSLRGQLLVVVGPVSVVGAGGPRPGRLLGVLDAALELGAEHGGDVVVELGDLLPEDLLELLGLVVAFEVLLLEDVLVVLEDAETALHAAQVVEDDLLRVDDVGVLVVHAVEDTRVLGALPDLHEALHEEHEGPAAQRFRVDLEAATDLQLHLFRLVCQLFHAQLQSLLIHTFHQGLKRRVQVEEVRVLHRRVVAVQLFVFRVRTHARDL